MVFAIASVVLLVIPTIVQATDLICCGAQQVFIIAGEPFGPYTAKPKWTWQASDSSQILAEAHSWFRSTDECKPIGDDILITSSSGGVALVRRKDKAALFYTYAKNAHSACLLPGQRVVVASSYGGDQLLVFDQRRSGRDIKPVAQIKLHGAHGAHWDAKRKRLWALGDSELLLIEIGSSDKPALKIEKRWKIPTQGGHDLFPGADRSFLFVSSNTHVYRFNLKTHTFAPDERLADARKVKSVDQHPKTGRVVYHQGTAKTWWSDRIRFAGSDDSIQLKGRRLYKVRFDIPVAVPE